MGWGGKKFAILHRRLTFKLSLSNIGLSHFFRMIFFILYNFNHSNYHSLIFYLLIFSFESLSTIIPSHFGVLLSYIEKSKTISKISTFLILSLGLLQTCCVFTLMYIYRLPFIYFSSSPNMWLLIAWA